MLVYLRITPLSWSCKLVSLTMDDGAYGDVSEVKTGQNKTKTHEYATLKFFTR